MARCVRQGVVYKRHQYYSGEGAQRKRARHCKACGKEKS